MKHKMFILNNNEIFMFVPSKSPNIRYTRQTRNSKRNYRKNLHIILLGRAEKFKVKLQIENITKGGNLEKAKNFAGQAGGFVDILGCAGFTIAYEF